MKYFLIALAISVCCFGLIEAGPNRRVKRAQSLGPCPPNKDCEKYAQDFVKGTCATSNVSGRYFSISSCGSVQCGSGLKKSKEDLSKPYPECCPRCVRG